MEDICPILVVAMVGGHLPLAVVFGGHLSNFGGGGSVRRRTFVALFEVG